MPTSSPTARHRQTDLNSRSGGTFLAQRSADARQMNVPVLADGRTDRLNVSGIAGGTPFAGRPGVGLVRANAATAARRLLFTSRGGRE